jgi:sphingomyelin phosphodiesterase 4
MNKMCQPQILFEGNPDIQPIRTYEVGFMVLLLQSFCNWFNGKYGECLATHYGQNSFTGALLRASLTSPTTYIKVTKSGLSVAPQRVTETLPPRICFRSLADKTVLGYYILVSLLFYCIGFKILTPLFLVIAGFAVYVLFNAVLIYFKGEGTSDVIHNENDG